MLSRVVQRRAVCKQARLLSSTELSKTNEPSDFRKPRIRSMKSYNISNRSGVSQSAGFPMGMHRQSRLDSIADVNATEMELIFLGTASCQPSYTRGVSCVALRYIGSNWLFDCGESTQLKLQQSCVRPKDIDKIFISHTHGDHFFGISAVLCMLGGIDDNKVVDIYGPEGVRNYIRATLQLSYSKTVVKHRIHELKNVNGPSPRTKITVQRSSAYGEVEQGRDIYPDEDGNYDLVNDTETNLTVRACNMVHTIPCVGFVVHEKSRPGRLKVENVMPIFNRNAKALQELNNNEIPYHIMKNFKNMKPGETFVFPDGTILTAEDAVEAPLIGRKVVIMGDTCSGAHIAKLAMDADVLVHEATNAFIVDSVKSNIFSADELEKDTASKKHSTPQMAGRFASSIRAKQLVLTHFSSRFAGDGSEYSMKIMWKIEDMARDTSKLTKPNEVIAAWDTLRVPINRREPI